MLRRELIIAYIVLLMFFGTWPLYFVVLASFSRSHSYWWRHCIIFDCYKNGVSTRSGFARKTPAGEPFIVPLAIPLMAGPSSLAMIMLMRKSAEGQWLELWLAVTAAWIVSAAILLASRNSIAYWVKKVCLPLNV